MRKAHNGAGVDGHAPLRQIPVQQVIPERQNRPNLQALLDAMLSIVRDHITDLDRERWVLTRFAQHTVTRHVGRRRLHHLDQHLQRMLAVINPLSRRISDRSTRRDKRGARRIARHGHGLLDVLKFGRAQCRYQC